MVHEQTVFFQDLGSNLVAYDLKTGEMLWQQPGIAPTAGPNGPAYSDGIVFASRGAATFSAFDAVTGEELWSQTF